MSIDMNDVSFSIYNNRWLDLCVGGYEVVSIDTIDGGVALCEGNELGNIIGNADDGFEFVPNDDKSEESNPYKDWPIDCKVLVWHDGGMKYKRHFAGVYGDGRPMARNGTSWSGDDPYRWDYAERVWD